MTLSLSIQPYTNRILIAFFLFISGCSEKANSTVDIETKKPVLGKTALPITLKGVPFDEMGVKEEIQKLCTIPSYAENRSSYCKFDEKGKITLRNFAYGNISDGKDGYATVDAEVTLNAQGAMIKFEMKPFKQFFSGMAVALEEKYGAPLAEASQISNRLGTKFEKTTLTWTDGKGNRITLESLYKNIDTSRVLIESNSLINIEAEAAQREKMKAKENL